MFIVNSIQGKSRPGEISSFHKVKEAVVVDESTFKWGLWFSTCLSLPIWSFFFSFLCWVFLFSYNFNVVLSQVLVPDLFSFVYRGSSSGCIASNTIYMLICVSSHIFPELQTQLIYPPTYLTFLFEYLIRTSNTVCLTSNT